MSYSGKQQSTPWRTHRGPGQYWEERSGSESADQEKGPRWKRYKSQSSQDPSCETEEIPTQDPSSRKVVYTETQPSSFVPPLKKDILLIPPKDLQEFLPGLTTICGNHELRNPEMIEKLLDIEYMHGSPYAPALKLLARILLGVLSRSEWVTYYILCQEAQEQSQYKGDKNHAPPLVKLSRALSHLLRHDEKVLKSGDERNAVDMTSLQKGIGRALITSPFDVFNLVACVAANTKRRFDFDMFLRGSQLQIVIFAFQGHSTKSSCFDPAIAGRDIFEAAPCLEAYGIIYHVTKEDNAQSIKRYGLLASVEKFFEHEVEDKHGRLAIHFLFSSKDPSLRGLGTTKYVRRPAFIVFNVAKFFRENEKENVYLSGNGVLLLYREQVDPKYLYVCQTEPNPVNIFKQKNVPLDFLDDMSRIAQFSDIPEQMTSQSSKDTSRDAPASKKKVSINELSEEVEIPSMNKGRKPTKMTPSEVQEAMKESEDIPVEEISRKDLETDPSVDVQLEFCYEVYEPPRVVRNSCSELTWKLLDSGMFYDRESHPDLGLMERKPIKTGTYDYQIWSQTWGELTYTMRERMRKEGYMATTWKSAPYSGLAVEFLFSAWTDAKIYAMWTNWKANTNDELRQREREINNAGNSDWNGRALELSLEEEDYIQEKKELSYDWSLIKETFMNFFTRSTKEGRNVEDIMFNSIIVGKIFKHVGGNLIFLHPWTKNIKESIIKHSDEVIDAEQQRFIQEDVMEWWKASHLSSRIEELDESPSYREGPPSKPEEPVQVKKEPEEVESPRFHESFLERDEDEEHERDVFELLNPPKSKTPSPRKSPDLISEDEPMEE